MVHIASVILQKLSPKKRPNKCQSAGFTKLELLVALAISAVLMRVAVPFMITSFHSIQIQVATHALLNSLMFARGEAITRNSRVVICKSSTGQSCNSNGGWQQGWVVFHDANNNAILDSDEQIISVQKSLQAGVHFEGNQPLSRFVSYTATGGARYPSGAFQAGTFTICNSRDVQAQPRQIVISSTGRSRVQKVFDSSCVQPA